MGAPLVMGELGVKTDIKILEKVSNLRLLIFKPMFRVQLPFIAAAVRKRLAKGVAVVEERRTARLPLVVLVGVRAVKAALIGEPLRQSPVLLLPIVRTCADTRCQTLGESQL